MSTEVPSAWGTPSGFLTAYTLTSALGAGICPTLDAIESHSGGLEKMMLDDGGSTWVGKIKPATIIPPIPCDLAAFECRSNQLIRYALERDDFLSHVARVRSRYGARRVACFIGTITAGLSHLETCYAENNPAMLDLGPDVRIETTVNIFSAADFCRRLMDLQGPAATISTACSSSAKALCTACLYLRAGLCDAAIVGGIDCLSGTIIYGFRSLGVLSSHPCRPWDRRRDGLSVGEAVGFALLERDCHEPSNVALAGYGESSDAFHMTAPHPEGLGAETAIRDALERSGLRPQDIDYINLHGSGTLYNDLSEDSAVTRVFGPNVACSSSKGWIGHTQGAAGIAEVILTALSIKHGIVPATLNTEEVDPALQLRVVTRNERREIRHAMSNSFGFGGSNSVIILSKIGPPCQ